MHMQKMRVIRKKIAACQWVLQETEELQFDEVEIPLVESHYLITSRIAGCHPVIHRRSTLSFALTKLSEECMLFLQCQSLQLITNR